MSSPNEIMYSKESDSFKGDKLVTYTQREQFVVTATVLYHGFSLSLASYWKGI